LLGNSNNLFINGDGLGLGCIHEISFALSSPSAYRIKKLTHGLAEKKITYPFEDHLHAQVERGAAGLCDVCNSGSIKGCLMFVQKDLI